MENTYLLWTFQLQSKNEEFARNQLSCAISYLGNVSLGGFVAKMS